MRVFKKAWTLFLCMALVLAMLIPAGVQAEEEQAAQTKELAQIRLSVGDGQETPVFKAGEQVSFAVNVMNKGNLDAQNVQITPVIEDVNAWPFDMAKMNYDVSLGTIRAGDQAVAQWGGDDAGKLLVREDVSGQSYKLVFKITYDDGQMAYETSKYVFVKTEAAQKPEEEQGGGADDGNQGSESQGEESNEGGDAGDGGMALDDGGIYNSEPVMSGGGSGSAADGSVPRVIVTGFETQPGEVRAGSDFKLIIHLKNTSKKTAVSNMLFDFQAPSSGTEAAAEAPAFLPTSGSSSIYLEKIPAGGTKDISIELNSRADLVQKPYSISMSMKYEDSSAAQFEAESSLAIPVKQEARFELSEIQIAPDTVAVGEESNITCNLYNLGRVKMYNVKASFEGEAIEGQEQFVGNLDSGATGVIDGIVTAVAESYDESNCKLVLTYEDDAGNVSTVEQEFTMPVTAEMDVTDMTMMEDMPQEESKIPLGGIILAIVIIAAAGAAAAVVIRRRKRKKLASEEEELMDEVERFTEDEHQQP